VFLRIKIILIFLLVSLSSYGQTFLYSYTDPCTNELKFLSYDMSTPIVVSYYGQTRAFTAVELQNGTFENWLNSVFAQNQQNPCGQVLASQTATFSTNLTTSVIQNVMNLTTLTSLASINVDVGGNVNNGSSQISEENNESNNGNDEENSESDGESSEQGTSSEPSDNQQGSSGGSANSSGSSSSGNSNGSNGSTGSSGNSGSNSGNTGGSNTGSSNGSGSSSSGSGSGSGSGGSGGNSSGGTNGGSTESGTGNRTDGQGVREGESQEGGSLSKEEIKEVKEEQTQTSSQQAAKSTSKAKTNTQKPAILMTGDIVGLQQTSDNSNDARATFSYTRVKGDGTSSLGVSADYMVNAKIGNITLMKSWIGADESGNKHINLVSSGLSLQPGAWSSTNMFIRVNSLKRFTAIYGAAGSFGYLYEEPMISTLLVGGFMYKGIMLNKIEATVIAAGVYSPYTKYYTETWWENRPVVIPFFNLNYKITKTFGMGITGGGTYLAGENVLNYQILLGAKLIL